MFARRPVLVFWLIAVALEVVFAAAFLVSGADAAIERGLSAAGLEFGTDLVTATRVVLAYPAAALGVALALGQVAAPDLAVLASARRRGGRTLLREVGRRFRFWSPEVGAARGVRIWLLAVAVLCAANLASGLLHRAFIPGHLTWSLGWGTLALLPIALFLDAGALLEENGWRGYVLPVLLRRHGPVAASLILGLVWASWHYPVKFNVFLDYGLGGGLAVLAAFTVKILALTVVMTFFWARAGQATILAIAMHGLSNDVARVGGLTEPTTWRIEVIAELNLALPLAVAAVLLALWGRRSGWGDLRGLGVATEDRTRHLSRT